MSKRTLKKRVLAFSLALLTAVSMYQNPVTVLADTFTSESEANEVKGVTPGESLVAKYTVPAGSFQRVKSISFDLTLQPSDVVSYTWFITSSEGTVNGNNSASYGSSDVTHVVTNITDTNILPPGEEITVLVQFGTATGVYNGGLITVETENIATPSDVTDLQVELNSSSIPNNTVYMSKDDFIASQPLTLSAIPYKSGKVVNRPVTFGYVSGASVAYATSGDREANLTCNSTGKTDILVKAGGREKTISFYVYDAEISSATYTGSPVTPAVTKVSDGAGGSTSVLSSSDYTVTCTDTEAGEARAKIRIESNGFEFYKSFTIEPRQITAADFSGATWTVDSNGTAVASVLNNGTDYIATAVLKSSVVGKSYYDINVDGYGNYKGSCTLSDVEIVASNTDINSVFTISVDDSSLVYDGDRKTPSYTVRDLMGHEVTGLTESQLKITYENNVNAGSEALLIAEGQGVYAGRMEVNFSIAPKAISGANVILTSPVFTDNGNYYAIRTGSEIVPGVSVSLGGVDLVEGADYTVSVRNNIDVTNNASVTIMGSGNYSGNIVSYFEIVPDVTKDIKIALDGLSTRYSFANGLANTQINKTYNGSEFKPTVKIYNALASGMPEITSGYSVGYANNVNAGSNTAEIIITFSGPLGGGGTSTREVKATFNIQPAAFASVTIVPAQKKFTYNGDAVSLTSSVKRDGVDLVENVDYVVNYSSDNPTDVGSYTAVYSGMGNYSGVQNKPFSIEPLDINLCTVKEVPNQEYTGNPITPDFVLEYNGREITKGFHAEYGSADHTSVGTVNLKIVADTTANNNLKGQKNATFKITKKSMADLTYRIGGSTLLIEGGIAESDYSAAYNGMSQSITGLTVTDTSTNYVLVKGIDYTVSNSNNKNIGTAQAQIRGLGNYDDGTGVIIKYTIAPKNIDDPQIDTNTYTVSRIPDSNGLCLPSFTITDNRNGALSRNPLVLGVDYEVVPKTECRTAGRHTCTIKGIGNYSGEKDVTYDIGSDISGAVIVLVYNGEELETINPGDPVKSVPHLGANVAPDIKFKIDGVLYAPSDLNLVIANMAGSEGDIYNSYGWNNTVSFDIDTSNSTTYFGSRTVSYKIKMVDLSSPSVRVVDNDPNTANDFEFSYTGNEVNIVPVDAPSDTGTGKIYLEVNGIVIPAADYDVAPAKIGPNIGVTNIKFTAANNTTRNYTGYKDMIHFSIVKNHFSTMSIAPNEDTACTGGPVRPKVVLKDDKGYVLTEGVDYSLSYDNNILVTTLTSKAKVTATGMNNYDGETKTIEFDITQVNFNEVKAAGKLTVNVGEIQYPGIDATIDNLGLIVKIGGVSLVRGVDGDYTAELTNVTNIGLADNNKGADIRITGTDRRYTGDIDVKVSVKADINRYFTATIASTTMTVAEYEALTEADVTVKDNHEGRNITLDPSMYTLVKTNPVPGIATLTVRGKDGAYGDIIIDNIILRGDLADADVSLVPTADSYTGRAVKPTVIVKYNGFAVEPTHYDITWPSDTVNVGEKEVVITPNNHTFWTGQNSAKYKVLYNISSALITDDNSFNYPYTGAAIEPGIHVNCADKILNQSDYYDVSYSRNTEVGTAQITIKAKPDTYAFGEQTITFKITAIPIDAGIAVKFDNGSTGKDTTSEIYTGDGIEPAVYVAYDGNVLAANKDYTVAYSNNVNVTTPDNMAKVRVTMKGNYSGFKDLFFTIDQKSITDADVEVIFDKVYYTGTNAPLPTYTIKYNGHNLKVNTDFNASEAGYATAIKYGSNAGKISFTGIKNFKGTRNEVFDIDELDISTNSDVRITSKTVYDGNNHFKDVQDNTVITYKGIELPNAHYDVSVVSAAAMINAGNYTIEVKGKDGFTGTATTDYVIEPAKIADDEGKLDEERFTAVISSVKNEYNGGNQVTPTVTVHDTTTGLDLVAGSDYTLTYTDNKNSGKGTLTSGPRVTITGISNYAGVYVIPFNIGTEISNANTTAVYKDLEVGARFTYDGKPHVPTIDRVTCMGAQLREGADYQIKKLPEDDINAGEKTIVITGKGPYYGDVELKYEIQPKTPNLTNGKIRITLPTTDRDAAGNYHITYTGMDIKPEVAVFDDDISTSVPIDPKYYNVTYEDNKGVGIGKAVVELKGNYNAGGETSVVVFQIRGHEMANMSLTLDTNKVPYIESASIIAPIERLEYNDGVSPTSVVLVRNYDYSIEYTYYGYDPEDPECLNPENKPIAGPALLTVNGLGNYTGELSKDFIVYGDLSAINYIIPDQMYTGGEVIPDVTHIWCGGRYLTEDDVKVSVQSVDGFENSGTLYLEQDNDYYQNRWNANFNVVFNSTNVKVIMTDGDSFPYTGFAIEPAFEVRTIDGALVTCESFDVSYKNITNGRRGDNVNAGQIRMTIHLVTGAKELSLDTDFTITKRDINEANVTIVRTNYYNGLDIYPYMQLRRASDGVALAGGTDYNALFKGDSNGNKRKPTVEGDPCVVTVMGIGNYTGTRDITYVIEAPALQGLRATDATDDAISLAWAKNRYASGYQVLLPNDEVVTLEGSDSTTFTKDGLNSSVKYEFKVRTYLTVNGTTYYGNYVNVVAQTGMSKATGDGSSNGTSNATVSWNTSTNVIGYRIYRSTSMDSGYGLVAIIPRSAGSYTDGNLTSGKTYYYRIQAYRYEDKAYVYGEMSDPIAITVK